MSDKQKTISVDEQWSLLEPKVAPAAVFATQLAAQMASSLFEGDDLTNRLEQKFRKGAKEFNGAWLTMNPDSLFEEAVEEAFDMIVYLCMSVVLANGQQPES